MMRGVMVKVHTTHRIKISVVNDTQLHLVMSHLEGSFQF